MNALEPPVSASQTRITGREVFWHLAITLLLVGLTLFARFKISRDDGLRAALDSGNVTCKTVVITRKWKHRDFGKSGDVVLDTPTETTYWASWNTQNAWELGATRINLSPQRWESAKVGGPLEIMLVAGEKAPRTRDDIALSQGNRTFDLGMLWVGQIGATLGILLLPLSLYAWRHPETSESEPATQNLSST